MPKDFMGRELRAGQTVLWPHILGRSPELEVRTVLKVEDGKVYLSRGRFSSRSTALQRPDRVYIIPSPAEAAEAEDALTKLAALEAAGVDNWEGYEHAMAELGD